jgi:hypothetical protein
MAADNVRFAHKVIVNNSKGYDRFGGSGVSHGDVQSSWMML